MKMCADIVGGMSPAYHLALRLTPNVRNPRFSEKRSKGDPKLSPVSYSPSRPKVSPIQPSLPCAAVKTLHRKRKRPLTLWSRGEKPGGSGGSSRHHYMRCTPGIRPRKGMQRDRKGVPVEPEPPSNGTAGL